MVPMGAVALTPCARGLQGSNWRAKGQGPCECEHQGPPCQWLGGWCARRGVMRLNEWMFGELENKMVI